MERNESGKWQFTPHEELIIAKAMVLEDHEARKRDELLVSVITETLCQWAWDSSHFERDDYLGEVLREATTFFEQATSGGNHPNPDEARGVFDRAHSALSRGADKRAFALCSQAREWLEGILDERWPLRHVEDAERYLDEILPEYALEEKAKFEAAVERLQRKET